MSGIVRLKPARHLLAQEPVPRCIVVRYWQLLAVEAVICGPVSERQFSVHRDNTGKITNTGAGNGPRRGFSACRSTGRGPFPGDWDNR
jgi:hypothetical protein